jgi:hypothetical protein
VKLLVREEHASFGGHRIERILGRPPLTSGAISGVIDLDGDWCGPLGIMTHVAAYIDATSPTPVYVSDGVTAVHVLWSRPRHQAVVFAGADPGENGEIVAFDVHPGDTVSIPARIPFSFGAGILAFVFGSRRLQESTSPTEWSRSRLSLPPTHGLQVFDRYNRRTVCAAHEDLLLERWKITEPQVLDLNPGHWHYLTNLVEPVALTWSGGSELLGRTESRLLPTGLSQVTIVPDGLGYVLIGSIPNLALDVIAPLRSAGYDRSAIASLGIPIDLLE